MSFDKGRLIDSITHLVPGRDDLMGTLQRGEHDATLIDLARFDAHRAAHPDTAITASGYYYPIGANRGYVGLASDGALIDAVNKALTGSPPRARSPNSASRPDSPIRHLASPRSSATSGRRSFSGDWKG